MPSRAAARCLPDAERYTWHSRLAATPRVDTSSVGFEQAEGGACWCWCWSLVQYQEERPRVGAESWNHNLTFCPMIDITLAQLTPVHGEHFKPVGLLLCPVGPAALCGMERATLLRFHASTLPSGF
jgi:hypothetical protein